MLFYIVSLRFNYICKAKEFRNVNQNSRFLIYSGIITLKSSYSILLILMFSQDDGVDLFKLYEKQIIAKKES